MKGFLNFKKGRFWQRKSSSSASNGGRTAIQFTPERKISINIINEAARPTSPSESFSSACGPPTEKEIDGKEDHSDVLEHLERLLGINISTGESAKDDLIPSQFNQLAKRYVEEGYRSRFIEANRFERIAPDYAARQWWTGLNETFELPMGWTVEEILMFYRYFKANKFVVDDTVEMWRKDLDWMKSVGYTELIGRYLYGIMASIPSGNDDANALFQIDSDLRSVAEIYPAGYYGRDLQGRPVYYDRVGKLNANEVLGRFSIDQLRRYWILSHEIMQRLILPSCSLASQRRIFQGVTVIDLNGLSMSHISGKTRQILKEVVCMSQAHYPESMALTLIINAPWVFHGVWKFIKPFIDKGSVQKIKILSSKGQALRSEMTKYISDTELPPFVSGHKQDQNNCSGWMFQPGNGPWTDHTIIRPQVNNVFPNVK